MDIHSPEDYRGWKTFQSPNKKSSVSIKPDGDITSLVSEKGQGMGKELVLTAIENGGIKLDAYDEFLP